MNDLNACADFLRRLIRTPSLPGEEGDLARLVAEEMDRLGYDEVRTDEVGNVIGTIRGAGAAPPLMFNTHLDHVDVGDHDRWPHPPYGGELHEGHIWGRGAVDIKGPLAAQVYGVARLAAGKKPPPGDVHVTAVVQEEIGGVGARHLLTWLTTPVVVIGEPSRNTIRRGHRGRTELVLHVCGRSAHASVPAEGANPYETVGRFLCGLEDLEMASDPELGASTCVPTLIRTDQTSANVIPGEIWLTCDWRQVPGESGHDARAILQVLADRCVAANAGSSSGAAAAAVSIEATVDLPVFARTAYTGEQRDIPADNPACLVPEDHPAVRATRQILGEALGHEPEVDVWQFATDGGHFAQAGMTCVGFGPGNELLAHTVREAIAVDDLRVALDANEALALALAAAAGSRSEE